MGDQQNPDDWLPEGWKVEVRVRKGGRKDKCYFSPNGEIKFKSELEVIRYLKNNEPISEREDESMQKKVESAQSLKKVVFEKAMPDGLPPVWTKEVKITKKAGRIRRDPYYTDPVSGYVFRSMKDALRYIETGELGRLAFKPKDKDDISVESSTVSKRQKLEDEETCLTKEEQSSKLDGGMKDELICKSTSPGESTAVSGHASDLCGVVPELSISVLPMADSVSQSKWKTDSNKSEFSVAPTGLSPQSSSSNPRLDKCVSQSNGKAGSNKGELSWVPTGLAPQLSSLDLPVDKSVSQSNEMLDSGKSELFVVSAGLAPQLRSPDPPKDNGVKQSNGKIDSSRSKLSLSSAELTPQSSNAGLQVDCGAKQSNGIGDCTNDKFPVMPAVEELQDKQSPDSGVLYDETRSTGSRKSKKKKDLNLPRRVSKRLAGVPLDPTPELKTVSRARRTIARQPANVAASMAVYSSHRADAEPEVIGTLDSLKSKDTPLELHKRSKGNAAASKELAKTGETARDAHENYEFVAAPPVAEQAAAVLHAGRFETDNNAKGKPEMPLDLRTGELWQDPCIAFAIKTLTGTLFDDVDGIKVPQVLNKVEFKGLATPEKFVKKEDAGDSGENGQKSTAFLPLHDMTLPEHSGGNIGMANKADDKTATSLGWPSVDSWSDPCIEFAIKTLTDAIPLDYSMVMQDFHAQQHSSSQLSENCGLNLPNGGEFCQTKFLCQQYSKSEKPSLNPAGFVGPAPPHPSSMSFQYSNGTGRAQHAEERSKKFTRSNCMMEPNKEPGNADQYPPDEAVSMASKLPKMIPLPLSTVPKMKMLRRPRGRPAGSKNKPKPPIIITHDSANALRAQAIEVSAGCDVTESLANFARRRQRGICLLSASGCVTNVTLRQPSSSGHIVVLHGQFEILSLLGSILPPPAPQGFSGLTIHLAGAQGHVVGGGVVGALIAAGPVLIMAASFVNATFDRLPLEDDKDIDVLELYGLSPHYYPTNGVVPSKVYPYAPGQTTSKS